MKTIAIVSQKGGAGKTTLAIHLAVAAEIAGYPTALLDMDPQGTAEAWAEWRNAENPVIVAAKATTLTRKLEQAATAGAGIVIIDTPPLAEAESREAARSADIVLIPCRPRAFDLHAVQTTADLAKFSGKPAFVIFNAAPPRGQALYIEAAAIVQKMGLNVSPITLSERAAFHHSVGAGKTAQEIEPGGKAAAEINKLWEWICQQVGVSTRYRAGTSTRQRVDTSARKHKKEVAA
jgi:chromosome partitioning protein